jgi:catechol 2,3-dioxygenase-like lactoylglutathione lyase family enzyme
MLSHVSIGIINLERSALFYDAIFAPLGFVRVWSTAEAVGYGLPGGDDEFAIKRHVGSALAHSARNHIAFEAANHDAVRAFHAAALAQGAADDGEPEYCAEYGANYFAAFVEDPDGYRLEAKALATGTGVL